MQKANRSLSLSLSICGLAYLVPAAAVSLLSGQGIVTFFCFGATLDNMKLWVTWLRRVYWCVRNVHTDTNYELLDDDDGAGQDGMHSLPRENLISSSHRFESSQSSSDDDDDDDGSEHSFSEEKEPEQIEEL